MLFVLVVVEVVLSLMVVLLMLLFQVGVMLLLVLLLFFAACVASIDVGTVTTAVVHRAASLAILFPMSYSIVLLKS